MKKFLSLLIIASLAFIPAVAGFAKESDGKKHRSKKTEKTVKSENLSSDKSSE